MFRDIITFIKLLLMKKSLLQVGTVLTKTEQKSIQGGAKDKFVACGCSADYRLEGGTSCSFQANGTIFGDPFPGGRCLGSIQDGMCCV